jgi:hypothetical protein
MIARIWHGWALRENADEYEALLREEIFRGIQERQILGLTGIALWRRETDGMTEFVTKMEFESLSAVESLPVMITNLPLSRRKRESCS